ncbi:protein of unknown function DUF540 [Solidesulfovibrio carbinoliphilus subsp. oakridgensis]|uniref:Uncharacterized protein n=1 Tax=Solidesulfovibrio carbinoliphilus subsp. oakridgensis TaxID=694327 RepID=G7Q4N8_9BACT|nr:EI24 domain-containing protein [Solidesulfovibrio carbinoliphilus]EHJ47498.1 protein of unknown function DUF540 [Solidesulfovibrio carbinoliphilus subsp. oakridgensis]
MLTAFPKGLFAHAKGIRFALAHKGYLAVAVVPFVLTLALFALGLGLVGPGGDWLTGRLWVPDPAATGLAGVLAWLYLHVVRYLLYLLAVVLMYFLFMVTANIVASPLYDGIAGRMVRRLRGEAQAAARDLPWWRVMAEEIKKAVFVAVLPVLLFFVPVVGQLLAPVAAACLLAFDFLDFAFCRDEPRFGVRLRALARRPLLLLGFGLPLLIPVVNIVLFPFAIFGATLLYCDTAGQLPSPAPRK